MTFPIPPPTANAPFTQNIGDAGYLSSVGLDFMQKLWDAVATGAAGFTIPNLVSDYGGTGDGTTSNDAAFTAAQADVYSEVWIPDGLFETTLPDSALTKHYVGRGTILFGSPATLAAPASFSYLATMPVTWPTQGVTGWFRGDMTFTDGGEYRVIGPGVREFNLTQRYFESTCIPHNAWWDVQSGNSGVQAFLLSGASIGNTVIPLAAAADASWVGKTVAFAFVHDGTIIEQHVVTAVNTAGNNITIGSPGLTNNYTWNPLGGQTPNIFFGPRSWNGFRYTKVVHTGGGDNYGEIVRLSHDYVGKATELHNFMRATAGQYGGDVVFNADIIYATGWESIYSDQGHNVSVIAQVDSFNRTVDTYIPTSGNTWLGTKFQSGGTRPCDAGHVLTGLWRNGLDTAFATLIETATSTANTTGGGNTITVDSVNGALVGDPIQIGDTPLYTGTISSISGLVVTVSPNLPGTAILAGTIVKYTAGGAVLNLKLGQRIVFNSSITTTARSGDSNAVYATSYGNVQGDMVMETGTDITSDYWAVRFTGNGHAGATARIRLRPTAFASNVAIQSGQTMAAALGLITQAGYGGNNDPMVQFGVLAGTVMTYSASNSRFEFYISNALVGHIP